MDDALNPGLGDRGIRAIPKGKSRPQSNWGSARSDIPRLSRPTSNINLGSEQQPPQATSSSNAMSNNPIGNEWTKSPSSFGSTTPQDLLNSEQNASKPLDSGAGGDTESANAGENSIPFANTGKKRFSLKNFKLTRKQGLIGGGIGGVIIAAIFGGSVMTTMPLINISENFNMTFNSHVDRATTTRLRRAWDNKFGNNQAATGYQRAIDRFRGISPKRADNFTRAGFVMICGDHICGASDLVNGRYNTKTVQFRHQLAEGEIWRYDQLKNIRNEALLNDLKRVYNPRSAGWFNSGAERRGRILGAISARLGLKSNRVMSQTEMDNMRLGMQADVDARLAIDPNNTELQTIKRKLDTGEPLTPSEMRRVFTRQQLRNYASNGGRLEAGTRALAASGMSPEDFSYWRTQFIGRGGSLSRVFTQSIRSQVRGAGLIGNLAGAVIGFNCSILLLVQGIVEDSYDRNAQRMNLGSTFGATTEQTKYGSLDAEDANGLMTLLNTPSAVQYESGGEGGEMQMGERNETFAEAPIFGYITNQQPITVPDQRIITNKSWMTTQSLLNAFSRDMPAWAANTFSVAASDASITACRILSNPAVQVAMVVAGIVISIITTVKTMGAAAPKLAIAIGVAADMGAGLLIGLGVGAAAGAVAGYFVRMMIDNVFDMGQYGADLMTAVTSGMSQVSMEMAMNGGVLMSTQPAMVAMYDEHQVYLAELREEAREGRSPFDVTTTHTFAGTFFSNLMPHQRALATPNRFLGAISSLFGSSFNQLMPQVRAADNFARFQGSINHDWCDFSKWETEGWKADGWELDENSTWAPGSGGPLATDPFCNVYRATPEVNMSPAQVLEALFNERMVEIVRMDLTNPDSELTTFIPPLRYECDGGFSRFVEVVDPLNGGYEGKIGNCTARINPLYDFQKNYFERLGMVGLDIYPVANASWESNGSSGGSTCEPVDGLPESESERAQFISDWEASGGKLDGDGNPCVDVHDNPTQFSFSWGGYNNRKFSTEQRRGFIGIDIGADKDTPINGVPRRHLMSTFFMDHVIEESLNGDMLWGGGIVREN